MMKMMMTMKGRLLRGRIVTVEWVQQHESRQGLVSTPPFSKLIRGKKEGGKEGWSE